MFLAKILYETGGLLHAKIVIFYMKTAQIFSFENKQKPESFAVKYCITFYQNITT